MLTDEKELLTKVLCIKTKNFLSWDILSKESGVSRTTIHRIFNTGEPIRLNTLRKLKEFVDKNSQDSSLGGEE